MSQTLYMLDNGVAGDVVVLASSSASIGFLKLATPEAIEDAGIALGILRGAVAEGAIATSVLLATRTLVGTIPNSITGLPASVGFARVGANHRAEWVAQYATGDRPLGPVDALGNLQLDPRTAVPVVAGASGGVSEAFAETVVMDRNAYAVYSGSSSVAFSLAASGHVNGTRKVITIPAYTATSVVFGADLHQTGDAFNATADYEIEIRRENGRVSTRTRSLTVDDAKAPTILYAVAPTAAPTTIQVVFDEPVYCVALTGLSLAFTSGTPRTLVSVTGKGTTTLTFTLSGALSPGDAPSFVAAASNSISDLNGNALPAQTVGVGWLTDPSELTGLTLWLEADSGTATLPAGVGGSDGRWVDKSAGNRVIQQATDANKPTVPTQGYDGRPTVRFDGVNDHLLTVDALSTFFTDTNKEIWIACVPRAVTTDDAEAFNNAGVMGHGYVGATFKATGPVAQFWTYDGGTKKAEVPAEILTPLVLHGRHNGSNVFAQRDGAAEVTGDAATTTDSMSSALSVGRSSSPAVPLNCDVMAVILCNAQQSAQKRDGIHNYLRRWKFNVPRLQLPPTLYAVAGVPTYLWFENALLTPHRPGFTFAVTGTVGGSSNADRWTWTPGSGDVGTKTLTLTASDLAGRVVASATCNVVVSAATGTGAVRVVLAGDSNTAAGGGYPGLVRTKLLAQGLTPTLLGTQGSGSDLHEGFPGQHYTWFSTHVDSPWVSAAGALDFAGYVASTLGGTPPDVLTIQLGTNDLATIDPDRKSVV